MTISGRCLEASTLDILYIRFGASFNLNDNHSLKMYLIACKRLGALRLAVGVGVEWKA